MPLEGRQDNVLATDDPLFRRAHFRRNNARRGEESRERQIRWQSNLNVLENDHRDLGGMFLLRICEFDWHGSPTFKPSRWTLLTRPVTAQCRVSRLIVYHVSQIVYRAFVNVRASVACYVLLMANIMSYLGGLIGRRLVVNAESLDKLLFSVGEWAEVIGGVVGQACTEYAAAHGEEANHREHIRRILMKFLQHFAQSGYNHCNHVLFRDLVVLCKIADVDGKQMLPDDAVFGCGCNCEKQPVAKSTIPPPNTMN